MLFLTHNQLCRPYTKKTKAELFLSPTPPLASTPFPDCIGFIPIIASHAVHMFYTVDCGASQCVTSWLCDSVRSGLLSVQISWSRAAAFRLAHLSNWYDTVSLRLTWKARDTVDHPKRPTTSFQMAQISCNCMNVLICFCTAVLVLWCS